VVSTGRADTFLAPAAAAAYAGAMPRPVMSHALVALLALAIGGAATATATQLLTGKDIKDGTIGTRDLSSAARHELQGKTGPRGRDGAPGVAGSSGSNGANGANGLAGSNGTNGVNGVDGTPGPIIVAASNLSPSYSTPGVGGSNAGTEAQAQVPLAVGYTASHLVVKSSFPPATNPLNLTLRINGSPSALTCAIPVGQTTCQTPAATQVVVPAGALIAISSLDDSAPARTSYSYRADP